jgi:hypothetical protein
VDWTVLFIITIARLLLSSFIPPPTATNMSRQQQVQHQHQHGTVSSSTLFDLDDAFLGANDEEHGHHGEVTFKDQVREDLLSASLATTAAAATPPRGRVAAAAADIPMVNAVAVSQSQISAEAEEDRLHDVERRAAAAETEAAAEAVRDQVAQLEQKLAAVRAPPRSGNRHAVSDTESFDKDDGNDVYRLQDAERRVATAEAARRDQEVRLAQLERQMANESNNNSGGSSPKQPSQRFRCCIVAVAVAVLIVAAAAVAGICGTGRCSSPSPVPEPVTPSPVASITVLPQPMPQPISQPVPQPVPVPVSIMSTSAAPARANTILPYINGITRSGRTLTYPSSGSAEERAVLWLIDDDFGTAVDDKQSLRQRYVLATMWFLQPMPTTTGFGSADHEFATTWTTNIDECEWSYVECDGNGVVTSLNLRFENAQGQIPADLGLLTDLTFLDLWGNQLSGTIPSSLGALTALTYLDLNGNQLAGTIPSSIGAMTALTVLNLRYNQLSGTIPSSLGALTALTFFDLGDNKLSGTIPSSLGALTALEYLWLHYNQLVGTMPFCNSDQSFVSLFADCANVNCTCCDGC